MSQGDLDKFLNAHSTKAQEWLEVLEEMLSDYDSYNWAESTLLGIYDYIDANGSITDGQIRAIQNIKSSVARNQRRWRR